MGVGSLQHTIAISTGGIGLMNADLDAPYRRPPLSKAALFLALVGRLRSMDL